MTAKYTIFTPLWQTSCCGITCLPTCLLLICRRVADSQCCCIRAGWGGHQLTITSQMKSAEVKNRLFDAVTTQLNTGNIAWLQSLCPGPRLISEANSIDKSEPFEEFRVNFLRCLRDMTFIDGNTLRSLRNSSRQLVESVGVVEDALSTAQCNAFRTYTDEALDFLHDVRPQLQ